jgi:hypothetical protein
MIQPRYDRVPPAIEKLPMPTLMRAGPYRLFIFMFDCAEPPHVHVEGNDGLAKFWLRPVSLADSLGYSPREINRIRAIVVRERMTLIRRFDEICERAQP